MDSNEKGTDMEALSDSRSHPKVFISYRRADTADVTGRIRDRLVAQIGTRNIFLDVESIGLGVDFMEAVASAISECDAILVVLCPSWLGITDRNGKRRLDQESDPVRIEIETALLKRKRIIPLLAGGARMPEPEELPETMRSFASLNGKVIRPDPDFDADINIVMRALLHGNESG
jgi:hypothetical protein